MVKGYRRYEVLRALQLNEQATTRDLYIACEIKSPSYIYVLLRQLEEEQLIKWDENIHLTPSGRALDCARRIEQNRQQPVPYTPKQRRDRGDVAMRRMTKAELAARIERVVKKALSCEQSANSHQRLAISFEPFPVVEHAERIGGCKVG